MDILKEISEYELKHRELKIAYGGDGTILSLVQRTEGKKAIIPFRNYGLCKEHEHRLEDFLSGKNEQKDLRLSRCPFIEYRVLNRDGVPYKTSLGNELSGKGIAEIVFKNADISEALRFNVYVNGKTYLKNVISDGTIVSTNFGSTGYFKSVARTIFSCNALGVAFIAPTQGINNLVLDNTSVLRFEFLRDAEVKLSADKIKETQAFSKGEQLEIRELPDAVSIFGLQEFHCYECRKNRHSIVEAGVQVQDQYMVV